MTAHPKTTAALQLNHPVPGFALPDSDGAIVRLASFKQRRPVLLALLHHTTCPDCRAWLARLTASSDELAYLCVQPLLIFPDDPATLQAVRAEMRLPGALLSDPAGETRARYLNSVDEPARRPHQSVLLVAVGRYNEMLAAWEAPEPSGWPPLAEPLATFAFAEQEDCACGLPIWPEA